MQYVPFGDAAPAIEDEADMRETAEQAFAMQRATVRRVLARDTVAEFGDAAAAAAKHSASQRLGA